MQTRYPTFILLLFSKFLRNNYKNIVHDVWFNIINMILMH